MDLQYRAQQCNFANKSTKHRRRMRQCHYCTTMHQLDHCASMKYRHTSRNTPADTTVLTTLYKKQPAKQLTPSVSMRYQLCRAPYLLPRPGMAAEHQETRTEHIEDCQLCVPRISTPPGTAVDPRTRETTQRRGHGQGNAENAQPPPTRPGLPHGGPRRAEPTEQVQSSGEKGPC